LFIYLFNFCRLFLISIAKNKKLGAENTKKLKQQQNKNCCLRKRVDLNANENVARDFLCFTGMLLAKWQPAVLGSTAAHSQQLAGVHVRTPHVVVETKAVVVVYVNLAVNSLEAVKHTALCAQV
jgi:hypothetical protein